MKILDVILQKDYWHGTQNIGRNYSTTELKGYYNDLTKKVTTKSIDLDELVPKVTVGNSFFLHPVTVCQVGLGAYELYLETKNNIHLRQAIICAEWLQENKVTEAFFSHWTVPYSFPLFELESGFSSGLIQGQATSLLSRIYIVTGDKKYMETAIQACNYMLKPVEQGGVYNLDEGIIEEYPVLGRTNFVLNGAISSTWALLDLYLVTRDAEYYNIFERCSFAIERKLFHFDIFGYSRYCLFDRWYYAKIASPYYHREHVEQLSVMYDITRLDGFKYYSERWRESDRKKIYHFISSAIKGGYLLIQKMMRLR